MGNKEAVLSRYPDAVAEHDLPDLWAIFDIPMTMTHSVRWNGDVARGRVLWGCGNTEAEAWTDARRTIERHEGKRLPSNTSLEGRGTVKPEKSAALSPRPARSDC